jgi:hypothetical protein
MADPLSPAEREFRALFLDQERYAKWAEETRRQWAARVAAAQVPLPLPYDPKFDADLKRLGEQLAGRAPVFVKEPALERGTIMWDVEKLPRVFAAPDVFDSLRRRFERRP